MVDEHGMNLSKGLNDDERLCNSCGNKFQLTSKGSNFFCKACTKRTGQFNLS